MTDEPEEDHLCEYTREVALLAVKQIETDLERDNFMSAEQAVEYGMIDTVLTERAGMGSDKSD